MLYAIWLLSQDLNESSHPTSLEPLCYTVNAVICFTCHAVLHGHVDSICIRGG